ncbi:hypothetical protein KR215_007637 [Drosophila sulfurigaster]|uniref:uncharacterized protein LOC133841003 n=1 Tax=Drosophila sulfurigaster albostrigata TaxID=89887 RepID=UPI002D21EE31|nr:uncharacterized protein LOC133841003 [Drosophila sulfurigaster albostrigata]XP_062129230.1 uncharacterized protein LOC133841003 [Drosophila sulfurigaster albostrigata]KAH8397024.1 hypothetical protein KR215_007637 [Drosophila sulfurigaster]
MSIDLYLHSLNSTLQAFAQQVEQFAGVALQAVVSLRSEFDSFTGDWRWQSPVEFTALQATLLQVLLVLLLGTGALIAWSWGVYGQVITEKFVRPSTLKEIEELKLSVAKLKLPKEHSPRI